MRKSREPSGYKTEEMLKEEARRRAEEERGMEEQKARSPGRKRAENFWYHYKWHTVAVLFIVFVAVFFLRDMLSRTDPDFTVVLVSTAAVSEETAAALEAALADAAWDRNGDGKVAVLVNSVYLASGSGQDALPAEDYAGAVKLTAVVVARVDPLYLVDRGAYEQLLQMAAPDAEAEGAPPEARSGGSVFEELDIPGTEDGLLPFSSTGLAEVPDLAPLSGFAFGFLPARGEESASLNAACLQLLDGIAPPR